MKFDSPLFDRIRVKPEKDRRRNPTAVLRLERLNNAATHRAPKGRPRENEYWRFCLEHVREYNHSYNYFSGMSDDAVLKYQKDAITGHRPTWKMGTGNAVPARSFGTTARDPFKVFRERLRGEEQKRERAARRPQRRAQGAERTRSRCRRRQGGDQGEVQDAGEAPPSRRQRRRPRDRGQAARDHPGLQLSEIGRFRLSETGRGCRAAGVRLPSGPGLDARERLAIAMNRMPRTDERDGPCGTAGAVRPVAARRPRRLRPRSAGDLVRAARRSSPRPSRLCHRSFMVVAWITQAMDYALAGLIGCFLFWALGVVAFRVAFSGFANDTAWFLFGALLSA